MLLAPVDQGLVVGTIVAPFGEPQVFPVIGPPRVAAQVMPRLRGAVVMDDARVAPHRFELAARDAERVIVEIKRDDDVPYMGNGQPSVIEAGVERILVSVDHLAAVRSDP